MEPSADRGDEIQQADISTRSAHRLEPTIASPSTTRRVAFTVLNALPPRKAGGASMWGRQSQAERLVHLRKAALVAMADSSPFQEPVRLTLMVHIGARHTRRKGDLDAYVAGVCDGLMAATPITHLADLWFDQGLNAIHPRRPIAIVDDFQVVSIRADKVVGTTVAPWYLVIVEETIIVELANMADTASQEA